MKFPKSVHADGWLEQFDKTDPEHLPEALNAGTAPIARPRAAPTVTTRTEEVRHVRVETPPSRPAATAAAFSAPPTSTVVARRQPAIAPWAIGAGAGAVLIAVGVMVAHNFAPSRDTSAPPTVMGEAKPSPEDAQIAAAPTSAGPVTPDATQTQAETPAVTSAPTPTPPVAVAAAPVEPVKPMPAPRAQVPAPQPQAVAKTLSPMPETLAQASPPPVTLPEPVQPIQPVTPIVTPGTPQVQPITPPPATMPEQATPTPIVPPMAQAQPTPEVAVADDAGITVKVRSALATDAMLSAVPIAVSTDHGVVKLEGQAPDTQARQRASLVAAATLGVKGVDNRLTLPPVAMLQQQLEPQQVARAPSN